MILSAASPDRPRWLTSAGLAGLLHGAIALGFLVHFVARPEISNPPAMAVELAPTALAPPAPVHSPTPAKQALEAPKAQPVKTPRVKTPPFDPPPEIHVPDAKPEVILPKASEQKPTVTQPLPPAPETSQEAAPDAKADPKVAAPMVGGVASGKPTAVDLWRARANAKLQQFQRYSSVARNRHEEGVSYVTMVVDRRGGIISARLVQSSGFAMLDDEAIAATHRAATLPKPPPEMMTGETIEVTIPFLYHYADKRTGS